MKSPIDNVSSSLEDEVEESLRRDAQLVERERAAKRVKLIMEGLARKIGLPGEVKMFGSFSNGFKTGSSDLDVVFAGKFQADKEVSLLGQIAELLPQSGFDNVTKIFQASTKLVKFTDMKTQMEVDFCISNELGVRNSAMLGCYCEYDQRAPKLGRLIKEWAKRYELVGSADGYLNSYAYMLLVIYYLQQTTPPVLPNLQALATAPVHVSSTKWGMEDIWDTKFCEDVKGIEESKNEMSVSRLLVGFFHYYAATFDWQRHAVCMRLSKPGQPVDKFKLRTHVSEDQWYVEDPFDLKHNLAGRCSRYGCERILALMKKTCDVLSTGGPWNLACPPQTSPKYLLKCRVGQGVTPQAFLEQFEEFDMVKLHFPKTDPGNRNTQAFLEFASGSARRRAHASNESYLRGCPHQLHLHVSTEHALLEAIEVLQAAGGSYSTFEMRAYVLQKQVALGRIAGTGPLGPPQQDAAHAPPAPGRPFQMDPGSGPPGRLGWLPGGPPLGQMAPIGGMLARPAEGPIAKAAAKTKAKAIANRPVPRPSGTLEKSFWVPVEVSREVVEAKVPIVPPRHQRQLEGLRASLGLARPSPAPGEPVGARLVELRVAREEEGHAQGVVPPLKPGQVEALQGFQEWARRTAVRAS